MEYKNLCNLLLLNLSFRSFTIVIITRLKREGDVYVDTRKGFINTIFVVCVKLVHDFSNYRLEELITSIGGIDTV